jgi:hypothetical protein
MRVCKHCRFFLPGSRGDCRETNAEHIADKEKANFCDWFSFDQKFRTAGAAETAKAAASAKTAFDDLFK